MKIIVDFINSDCNKFDEFIDLALGLSVYNDVAVYMSYLSLMSLLNKEHSNVEHVRKRLKMLELYDLTPLCVYKVPNSSSFREVVDNHNMATILKSDENFKITKSDNSVLLINF